jgi:hypothetical protein
MSLLNKNSYLVLFLAGVYLSSTGLSYAVFNYLNKPTETVSVSPLSEEQKKSGFIINTEGPKTEACPLNGQLYTKEEKTAWEKRRPLFIMIENHQEARPQSGLSSADVVYEAVAEGGISRFGAVFYCGAQSKDTIVGPVRSARTYFLDWASEYGGQPLYVHVGGANTDGPANALGQIEDYGWGGGKGNDINQFSVGFPTFWRDYERLGRTVATEHTMYSTTEKLWKIGADRGWGKTSPEGEDWTDNFRSWKFAEASDEKGQTANIKFNFWEGYNDYAVEWLYDSTTNSYKRNNGGQETKDLNTDQPLKASSVVIQFQKESRANDGYEGNLHMLYGTKGEGKALFFQNGQTIKGTWSKKSRLDRTVYSDQSGKEITFVRGPIWIETVATDTSVEY